MANKIRYIDDDAGDHVFPVTHERGVLDSKGVNLESKLLRPLTEWALDGAGNTFVSIQWTGVMPGHKYRFWIKFWPNSEVTQHGTNYAQCAIWSNSSASRSNALAGAFGNDTVAPLYDVVAPADCAKLLLGGRINSGAEGIVLVEDVTYLTTKLNQMEQRVGIIGTSEVGFFLVDSALKVAAKYDNDGFDVAKLSAHFQSLINVQQGIFIDVIEDGFFVVDAQYNIGLALTANGIAAKNTVSARIVTL